MDKTSEAQGSGAERDAGTQTCDDCGQSIHALGCIINGTWASSGVVPRCHRIGDAHIWSPSTSVTRPAQ